MSHLPRFLFLFLAFSGVFPFIPLCSAQKPDTGDWVLVYSDDGYDFGGAIISFNDHGYFRGKQYSAGYGIQSVSGGSDGRRLELLVSSGYGRIGQSYYYHIERLSSTRFISNDKSLYGFKLTASESESGIYEQRSLAGKQFRMVIDPRRKVSIYYGRGWGMEVLRTRLRGDLVDASNVRVRLHGRVRKGGVFSGFFVTEEGRRISVRAKSIR